MIHSFFRWGDRDMDRRRATFFTLCTYHIKALLPRTYYVAHTLRTKCLQVGLGGCMLTVCSLEPETICLFTLSRLAVSTQCQHKLVYIANRRSSLPLLYSLDGSSLLQQSNCLGGSQQECGRLLALPFLAKLCASTAAVPARPAQHTRQGSHNPEGSHVGNSPQGLFGSGWKTPGKKEKGWKGQNTGTYLHVVKSHHLS